MRATALQLSLPTPTDRKTGTRQPSGSGSTALRTRMVAEPRLPGLNSPRELRARGQGRRKKKTRGRGQKIQVLALLRVHFEHLPTYAVQ